MVWKSIIFTFCLIKLDHMIKVSAQTFSTGCRTKFENKVSDLFDNLYSFLRFYKNNFTIRIIIRIIIRHRNKYCLKLKEFNCISQPYRSSLSYIKGRSDFQAKGLKKERDLKSTAADRNSITIFYINAFNAIMLSYRCFFKIMNFSDRFRQCFKPF